MWKAAGGRVKSEDTGADGAEQRAKASEGVK